MISVILQLVSFLYIFLISIIYFSKNRVDNLENRIYSRLIVSNLIGLIFDISSIYTIKHMNEYPVLNTVITRCYLLYLLYW